MSTIRLIALLSFFCVAFIVAAPAQATPVDKATANHYFTSCMANHSSQLSKDSQESMCACTSAQLLKSMTLEDMQAAKMTGQAGKIALNKMLINVYAPCLSDPIRDLVLGQCRGDKQIMASPNAANICGCVVRLTGDWYALSGRQLMGQALKDNPNLPDLTGPIIESDQFRGEEAKNVQACMQGP